MKIIAKAIALPLAAALLAVGCARKAPADEPMSTPPSVFDDANDYDQWADSTGYAHGSLLPQGAGGIYMDRFMSLPDDAGYASGRIVIGDSRSCQLGIYQQRARGADFAAFAVWGGHYASGSKPPIMTDTLMFEVKKCFRKQIEAHESCTVFFFATVNDYDYERGENDSNISEAVRTAERFASMEYEYKGRTHRPRVIVIGFDGCKKDASSFEGSAADEFNRYVSDYNAKLKAAVEASELLKAYAEYYTTVPEIVGETGFISDRLHYDDATLNKLCGYIRETGK